MKREILGSIPFHPGKDQKIDFKTCMKTFGTLELLAICNFLLESTDANALLVIEARLHDERLKYFNRGIPQEQWPEPLRSENWCPVFYPLTALSKLGNPNPVQDEVAQVQAVQEEIRLVPEEPPQVVRKNKTPTKVDHVGENDGFGEVF